jgi:hypothetical protein
MGMSSVDSAGDMDGMSFERVSWDDLPACNINVLHVDSIEEEIWMSRCS